MREGHMGHVEEGDQSRRRDVGRVTKVIVTQQKTQIKSRDTTDALSHKEFIDFSTVF